jgi:hypothetical protein
MLSALLRTVVPALWGSVIAWPIGVLPILAPLKADLAGLSDIIQAVITAVIIAGWYALWRWLEPRLPEWFTRARSRFRQGTRLPGQAREGTS